MAALSRGHVDAELQTALFDFQRYLLDQIPPLTASDAIEVLMAQPPELLMKQIHAWSLEQSRHQSAAQSDFLFHALKKVYLFSVLKLIDHRLLERYLDRVVPLALQVCPADEREPLRISLAGMREAMVLGGSTSTVVPISRDGGSKPAVAEKKTTGVSDVAARTARRLSLVIDRLAKHLPFVSSSPEPQAQPQPAAQLVSMAAASATSEAELQAYVKELKPYTGGESDPAKLFHVLAGDVPQWEVA
jgi:hypothetical protein